MTSTLEAQETTLANENGAVRGQTGEGNGAVARVPVEHVSDEPQRWRISSDVYRAMHEQGLFGDAKVELVEGEIVHMAAFQPPHVYAQGATYDLLRDLLRGRFLVRSEAPLSVPNANDPEPDIAVVTGTRADYVQNHPTTALLVVEIADATISYDRNRKAPLYALAQVPDYWILNVRRRTLEIRRDPRPDSNSSSGFSYGTLQTFDETSRVSPICAPDVSLLISDLLPLQAATPPDTSLEIAPETS